MRRIANAAAFLLAAGVVGCTGGQRALVDDPARAYPVAAEIARPVDVHVLRNDTRITMTNTTPEQLGPGIMWLNKEFSAPFAPMHAGETRTLPLGSFTNRYGQSFRAGGFFATRAPSKLVAVELQAEDAEVMVPLIVVRGEGN